MTAPRRLAVLHDSQAFGGHELAFLNWFPAVLASPDIAHVHVVIADTNLALRSKLEQLGEAKLTIVTTPFYKSGGETLRAPLRFRYGRAIRKILADAKIDLALMLQGRIENLATPMIWLPRDLEVVSYLPMAHTGAEMGRPGLVSTVLDCIKRVYYARPQRFLVVSKAVASQVRRAGARGAIQVVENVLPPNTARRDKAAARASIGVGLDARVALFMGRFDSLQKGLDRLMRDLRAAPDRLSGWTFLFVGEGPAENELQDVLAETGLNGHVVGWTPEAGAYLAASDVLLMPSRFEGVPLTMLEALNQRTPMLTSDIDVFQEYLPKTMRRDFERPVDLATALAQVSSAPVVEAYEGHASAILDRLNLKYSRQRFVDGLLGRLDAQ